MISLLQLVITPAIVSSIVTLLVNIRLSKQKEIRDSISKKIDEARKLVSESVDAAANYFSLSSADRTAQLEAKLWMCERELRMTLSALTSEHNVELNIELKKLQTDFDVFISELTGGNFQQKNATGDLPHIRRIAGIGSDLRLSLLKASEIEINKRLDNDWITYIMKFFQFGRYYTPIRDN